MHPIHVVKNKIDESRNNKALHVRRPNIPKVQRPEFQVVKTTQESGLPSCSTSKDDLDDKKDRQRQTKEDPTSDPTPTTSTVRQENEEKSSTSSKRNCGKSCEKVAPENSNGTASFTNNEEGTFHNSEPFIFHQEMPNKYAPLEVNFL